MKEVIRIPGVSETEKEEKRVEFTHFLRVTKGWEKSGSNPEEYDKIIYLGNCSCDGDMFVAYSDTGYIQIYKGHLNSGKY